jgi:hypothetical protein
MKELPEGRSAGEVVGGACLCGAVKIETTLPSLWSAHCHCSSCRRAHGAAFVTYVDHKAPWWEINDSLSQRGGESGTEPK